MTELGLIAGVIMASILIGLLLALNLGQWSRLKDQRAYYEGRLQEKQADYEGRLEEQAARIKSIGQQLRNVPKRSTDKIVE